MSMFTDIKEGKASIDDLLHHEVHISEISPTAFRYSTIASGFPTLDDYGLLKQGRSELILIGARPSMGKSALLFQLAYNVSQHSPVHVFSLEMDKESIAARLIAGHINRSMTAIQTGAVPDEMLIKAHNDMSGLKYYIDDRSGLHIDFLCESAIKAHAKHGIKMVCIDYLQLIVGRDKGNQEQELSDISRSLKALARELKVPVVVAAQLNRQNELRGMQTGDYRPIMSDLRGSGSLEQDADMILFIHREYKYTGQREGEADIFIEKNRNGATGTVVMQFTAQQTRFIDKKKYEDI